MSGLPYSNARLVRISGVGNTPDYDDDGAQGSSRWTGDLPVTVRERREELIAGDRVDEIFRTEIKLPYGIGRIVQRGDSLTFTFAGEQHSRTAGTIVRAELADRVRVILEDA